MRNRENLNDIANILPENPEKALKIIKNHIAEAKQWLVNGITAQSLIFEIRHSMAQIFDYAAENHLLEKLFRYFMKDIKSWLITLRQSSGGNLSEKTFLFPFLAECACITGKGLFNRFKHDMREQIESSVLDFLKTRIAEIDRNDIRYLSLGSGEMLQDFIIINQLLLLLAESDRKVTKVEVTLIDPIYENLTENLINTGNQFNYLNELANELGISFSLEIFPSIEEFLANDPKPLDVIMATDFEQFHTTAFKSAIKAHKMLDPQGQMFLSFWKERYIFSKTQSLSPLLASSCLSQFPLNAKKHVKIASLIERNLFTVYPIILPYIQRLKNCETVTLTLPQPQKINNQGFWMGSNYPDLNISCADLNYFFALFVPNIKLTVTTVTGYENFEMLLPQFDEDQDLVLCFDGQYKQVETLFEDIASVHNKFISADILFKMQIVKGTASQSEKPFRCRWIYEQAENLTNILNGDNASVEIFSQAYQFVVAENLKRSNCSVNM